MLPQQVDALDRVDDLWIASRVAEGARRPDRREEPQGGEPPRDRILRDGVGLEAEERSALEVADGCKSFVADRAGNVVAPPSASASRRPSAQAAVRRAGT